MNVGIKYNKHNFTHYIVTSYNSKYNVYCLDKVYLCECAIKYNRDIKKHCKHIKEVIKKYK